MLTKCIKQEKITWFFSKYNGRQNYEDVKNCEKEHLKKFHYQTKLKLKNAEETNISNVK